MAAHTETGSHSETGSSAETGSRAEAGKHVHHGRTAAAWAGSMLAMVAFILGGVAVMMQNWVLFGVAVLILVVGLVATKVLQVRGHGAL